jgi:hypothetical protein
MAGSAPKVTDGLATIRSESLIEPSRYSVIRVLSGPSVIAGIGSAFWIFKLLYQDGRLSSESRRVLKYIEVLLSFFGERFSNVLIVVFECLSQAFHRLSKQSFVFLGAVFLGF